MRHLLTVPPPNYSMFLAVSCVGICHRVPVVLDVFFMTLAPVPLPAFLLLVFEAVFECRLCNWVFWPNSQARVLTRFTMTYSHLESSAILLCNTQRSCH